MPNPISKSDLEKIKQALKLSQRMRTVIPNEPFLSKRLFACAYLMSKFKFLPTNRMRDRGQKADLIDEEGNSFRINFISSLSININGLEEIDYLLFVNLDNNLNFNHIQSIHVIDFFGHLTTNNANTPSTNTVIPKEEFSRLIGNTIDVKIRVRDESYITREEKDINDIIIRACKKGWCWNIGCTTCGCIDFYSALHLLTRENKPIQRIFRESYRPDSRAAESRMSGMFTRQEQLKLQEEIKNLDLRALKETAKFPDWLGYIGLCLFFTENIESDNRVLTNNLVPKILEILPPTSLNKSYFQQLIKSKSRILRYLDLNRVESDLLLIKKSA